MRLQKSALGPPGHNVGPTFWATDPPSEPQLRRSASRRRCGWTRLAGVCSSLRVSDQLSDHYCAEVSSAEVPYALADLVADISDVVEAYPAGSSEPSPRSGF